jgi:hypothetical protein
MKAMDFVTLAQSVTYTGRSLRYRFVYTSALCFMFLREISMKSTGILSILVAMLA